MRDLSRHRAASRSRAGDYRRSGDYYRRDYEQRFRECSPRRDQDYEDYFCRDNTEFGGYAERRPRDPSTGRDRARLVTADNRSSKRYATKLIVACVRCYSALYSLYLRISIDIQA